MLRVPIAIVFSLAAAVAAQTDPSDLVILKSESLQLAFTHDGRLVGLTPTSSNDNYLKAPDQPPPLVEINLGNADGSGQIKAYPLSPRVSISNGTASIESELVRSAEGDVPVEIRVSVQLAAGSAESRWTVRLSNHDLRRTVFGVTLPRISGVRLGSSSADDELYLPYWGGERFPHAVEDFTDIAEKRLSPLEMGSRKILKQDGHYVRELSYAGGASMMWLDYVDRQQGLILGLL